MDSVQSENPPQQDLNDSGYVQDASVSETTYKGQAHLLDLSDDVLLCILRYCNPMDLKALGHTCPRLGALVCDRTLWTKVDARSTPVGEERLRWLLTHCLTNTTTELKLTGYVNKNTTCLGIQELNFPSGTDTGFLRGTRVATTGGVEVEHFLLRMWYPHLPRFPHDVILHLISLREETPAQQWDIKRVDDDDLRSYAVSPRWPDKEEAAKNLKAKEAAEKAKAEAEEKAKSEQAEAEKVKAEAEKGRIEAEKKLSPDEKAELENERKLASSQRIASQKATEDVERTGLLTSGIKEDDNKDCKDFEAKTKAGNSSKKKDILSMTEDDLAKPFSDDETSCHGPQFTMTANLMKNLKNKCSSLTSLSLEYCNLDYKATNLRGYPPKLKKLSLRGTRVYNLPLNTSYLCKIQERLPELEYLDVSECDWFEPASLMPLSKVPHLHELHMRECKRLTECVAYTSLATRYGFRELRVIDIRGSPLADSEVSALGWLPALEELYCAPPEDFKNFSEHSHKLTDQLPTFQELDQWELQIPDYYKVSQSSEFMEEDDTKEEPETPPPSGVAGERHQSDTPRTSPWWHGERRIIVIQPNANRDREPEEGRRAEDGNRQPHHDIVIRLHEYHLNRNHGVRRENRASREEVSNPGENLPIPEDRPEGRPQEESPQEPNPPEANINPPQVEEPVNPIDDNGNPLQENCPEPQGAAEAEGNLPNEGNLADDNGNRPANRPRDDNMVLVHEYHINGGGINAVLPNANDPNFPRLNDDDLQEQRNFLEDTDYIRIHEVNLDRRVRTVEVMPIGGVPPIRVQFGKRRRRHGRDPAKRRRLDEPGPSREQDEFDQVDPEPNDQPRPGPSRQPMLDHNYPKLPCHCTDEKPNRPASPKFKSKECQTDATDDASKPESEVAGVIDEPMPGPSCEISKGSDEQMLEQNQEKVPGALSNDQPMSDSKESKLKSSDNEMPSTSVQDTTEAQTEVSFAHNEDIEDMEIDQKALEKTEEESSKRPDVVEHHSESMDTENKEVGGDQNDKTLFVSNEEKNKTPEEKPVEPDNSPPVGPNQPPDANQPEAQNRPGRANRTPPRPAGLSDVLPGELYDRFFDALNRVPFPGRNNRAVIITREREGRERRRERRQERRRNQDDQEPNEPQDPRPPAREERDRRPRMRLQNDVMHVEIENDDPLGLSATLGHNLISDASILRFGRAENDNVNYVHIGRNGVQVGYEPGMRPERSNLRVLSVTGYRNITDRSLEHLATAAPFLRSIDFSETNVSPNGVEVFKALRPNCDVVYSKFGTGN